MKRYAALGLVFVLLLAVACSDRVPETEPTGRAGQAADTAETVLPSTTFSATCVYVEGFVERGREGSWATLEIGDSVEADDSIRTGPDGVCEVQFGGSAAVRVQPSTLFMINTLALSDTSSQVDGSLAIGTILNKVSKLAGNDSYMIRTETSVAGVRGTEFVISTDSVKGTTVAVKEGKVAMLPVSQDVYDLLDQAETNPVAAAAVQSIVSGAVIVEADQELTVDEDDAAQAALVYSELAKEVAAIPAETVQVLVDAAEAEAALAAGQEGAQAEQGPPPALRQKRALITAGDRVFTTSVVPAA
ncbi:MAG TPA: FecR domain-containing protein, partial [Spirochaetales bacterium]|nr:FecR domain-containing protein [Spirochaetales bacterium]